MHLVGSADVTMGLLSGFELRCDGDLVAVPPGSQRLLAFLALQSRPVSRSFVSGSLWPDATQDRASARLRSAMWRAPAPQGLALLSTTTTHLGLRPEVKVDYREVVFWATALVDGHAQAERISWTGLAEASQEILPDWYDEWVLVERERFRQLRLHALETACEQLVREGRYAQALMAGLAAVAAEPLRESAHRLVVMAHIGEGNLYEAFRQYRSCAALLESELGLSPSAAMESLLAPLGGQRQGRQLRPDASALRSAD